MILKRVRRAVNKRRARFVMGSSTFLMTVYLYQGNRKFFEKHFSRYIADERLREMAPAAYQHLSAYALFFLAPNALSLLIGRPPWTHRLRPGRFWWGIPITAAAAPICAAMGLYSSRDEEFRKEYPLSKSAGAGPGWFLLWELAQLHYYIGWEYFFRGYQQAGIEPGYGAGAATAFQTLSTTLMHIGKPAGETWAAFFAGPLFGWISRKTNSVLYPTLIHFMLGFFVDYFCLRAEGKDPFRG